MAADVRHHSIRGYFPDHQKFLIYLPLVAPRLALSRVAARVKQGGHNVPRADVVRRFKRGWANFLDAYRPLADAVMAAEPVVRGRAEQVTVAVSTVVVFGTLAIFLYLALYHLNAGHSLLPASPTAYGIFARSTIHEVA